MTTEIPHELRDELVEPFGYTPAQYAAMCERYHALKTVLAYVIEGGETVKKYELEREAKALNDVLHKRVETHGPIHVEGLPPLILQERSERWLRADALIAEAMRGDRRAARLLQELIVGGLLTVKWTVADALKKAGQLQGLSEYEVRGNGTPALTFDRRPGA